MFGLFCIQENPSAKNLPLFIWSANLDLSTLGFLIMSVILTTVSLVTVPEFPQVEFVLSEN